MHLLYIRPVVLTIPIQDTLAHLLIYSQIGKMVLLSFVEKRHCHEKYHECTCRMCCSAANQYLSAHFTKVSVPCSSV